MARILIVEDNVHGLELMRYLLHSFGHTVTARANAIEALEDVRTTPFDLILSDVLMPGMDGFGFAQAVRAEPAAAGTKVVAVTALAMVGDRERIIQGGFDGYIAKPIEPERFAEEVEGFIVQQADAGAPVVLAVDDNEVNLGVIDATLRPVGYRVITAQSAREAIDVMHHEVPNIILSDIHMSDADGFALIEHVKRDATLSSIPFIFISSTAWHTSDRKRGMELGAEKFILRPIDPQRLISEIASSLESDG